MKKHEIDCFDMKEGKILYTQNKIKAPLSKKHLMGCLLQYLIYILKMMYWVVSMKMHVTLI